jgi:glycosyltransferase involved in cell wall biosynthesis
MTEFVGGTSLYRLVRCERPPVERIHELVDQVARLCARLVELQVSHNDLKPENLLIDAADNVWLIDLEKMRRHQHRDDSLKRLLEDLNRLMHPRNWRDNPTAGEQFRQRLLAEPVVAEALDRFQPAGHLLVKPVEVDPDRRNRLSVLVISPQSAANLRACVDSFRDVADQIVVCGDCQDDETQELARTLGAELVEPVFADEHAATPESIASLRNRALAAARDPWVLVVEGDERVSPDLAKEIQCTLTAATRCDAYRIQRRRLYLGHVNRFGEHRQDAPIRLFRNGLGGFQAQRGRPILQVHAEKIGRLKSKLMHYLCWHLTEWIRSADEQASQEAMLRYERDERPCLAGACVRAARRFAVSFLWKHGWLDGRVGLQLSLFAALSELAAEAKLWELHYARRMHDPAGKRPTLGLRLFRAIARIERPPRELRRAS